MVKVIGAVTVLVDRMGMPQCAGPQRRPLDRRLGGRDADVHAISFPPHRVSSQNQNEPEHK
jgi:hypothetical protein